MLQDVLRSLWHWPVTEKCPTVRDGRRRLSCAANSILNCDVALVGVQPGSTTLDASLSPPVQQAIQLIAQAVASYLDDPAGS